MNVPMIRARMPVWVAMGCGALAAGLFALGQVPTVALLKVPLDFAAVVLMRRRRWRFPVAVWFGTSAFVVLIEALSFRSPELPLLARSEERRVGKECRL